MQLGFLGAVAVPVDQSKSTAVKTLMIAIGPWSADIGD
jgi:hypothetical protein